MIIEIKHTKDEEKEAKDLVKDIRNLNKDFGWGLKLEFNLKSSDKLKGDGK